MVTTPFWPFELENWQSDFEQTVRFNLSDSTIDPVPLRELVGATEVDDLLDTALYYPEVNGERSLRERIASTYVADVRADDVLVTVGASEANAAIVDALCRPGGRTIVMEPGYRQVWGLARNRGCDVHGFALRPEDGWAPDLDQLSTLAVQGTDVIYVCNPNNPVGYILTDAEMAEIVAIAERSGAWLVADEVYQGSEHDGSAPTRTFVGMSDRVIGVNSMSKSYGLSGLRIGWVTATPEVIAALWRRHEYAAIATGRLDNMLAERALRPEVSGRLLDRNRAAMRSGWQVFEDWMAALEGRVKAHRPAATPLAFFEVASALGSVEIGDRLRREASVLGCPGVFFGQEGYLRLNFGFGVDHVSAALEQMIEPIMKICQEAPR